METLHSPDQVKNACRIAVRQMREGFCILGKSTRLSPLCDDDSELPESPSEVMKSQLLRRACS